MRYVALACLLILVPLAVAQEKADVPALVKQLKDKDAFVRLKAAKTLGTLGAAAREALPALKELLKDPDEDVQAVAKKAVEKINEDLVEAPEVADLTKDLKSKDAKKRLAALESLGRLGRKARSADVAVVESLLATFPKNRDEHFETLGKIHPDLAKNVIAMLVDEKSQPAAIEGLTGMGQAGRAALPILILYYGSNVDAIGKPTITGKTQSTHVDLVKGSLTAAVAVAPSEPATSALIASAITYRPVTDAVFATRLSVLRRTAIQLSSAVQKTPHLTAALASALGDKKTAAQAATALGELGSEAKSAVPALVKMKFDGDSAVREAVAKALEKIGQ